MRALVAMVVVGACSIATTRPSPPHGGTCVEHGMGVAAVDVSMSAASIGTGLYSFHLYNARQGERGPLLILSTVSALLAIGFVRCAMRASTTTP